MPRPAPPRRTPPPRRKIVWLRAAPIFIAMMALLFGGQELMRRYPEMQGSPLGWQNGLGLSLVAGIIGAFAISRWATITPPPPPSKTQQRKLASAAARGKGQPVEEDEEPETVPARLRQAGQRRKRRRR
jgi:hypothetical protein